MSLPFPTVILCDEFGGDNRTVKVIDQLSKAIMMIRVTSTDEKTTSGAVIAEFEYTYDDLSKIVVENIFQL